jgi:hypothetical protein
VRDGERRWVVLLEDAVVVIGVQHCEHGVAGGDDRRSPRILHAPSLVCKCFSRSKWYCTCYGGGLGGAYEAHTPT